MKSSYNAETLKNLTADKLVNLLSQDVVNILEKRAIGQKRKKAYLVEWLGDRHDDFFLYTEYSYAIWASYDNVLPNEISWRIIKDLRLAFSQDKNAIYHSLLVYAYCDDMALFKKHKIFKEFIEWFHSPKELHPKFKIKQELIEYLYTNIRQPEDIIYNLQDADYIIVWENESFFNFAKKNHLFYIH